MVCIYCQSETNVSNSRHQKRRNTVWRRRTCQMCQAVFTTIEAPDDSGALSVMTPQGQSMSFAREKLFLSLYRSLQHRPSILTDAIGLTDTVVAQIYAQAESGSIATEHISRLCLTALEHFDEAAAVHYRAFHKA